MRPRMIAMKDHLYVVACVDTDFVATLEEGGMVAATWAQSDMPNGFTEYFCVAVKEGTSLPEAPPPPKYPVAIRIDQQGLDNLKEAGVSSSSTDKVTSIIAVRTLEQGDACDGCEKAVAELARVVARQKKQKQKEYRERSFYSRSNPSLN